MDLRIDKICSLRCLGEMERLGPEEKVGAPKLTAYQSEHNRGGTTVKSWRAHFSIPASEEGTASYCTKSSRERRSPKTLFIHSVPHKAPLNDRARGLPLRLANTGQAQIGVAILVKGQVIRYGLHPLGALWGRPLQAYAGKYWNVPEAGVACTPPCSWTARSLTGVEHLWAAALRLPLASEVGWWLCTRTGYCQSPTVHGQATHSTLGL